MGKWFTEGMAFARNTRLIYLPLPTFPIPAAHPRNAKSTNIRFQADMKIKMTRNTRRSKHYGQDAHMGWMTAMGADGLILEICRRSFRLARLGLCLKSCPLHQITPTTSVLPGLAWRDSAIFVVLVDSPYSHKLSDANM